MKTLKIKSLNVVINSNEDGLFNLNDLHKQANLNENKAPNQWRNEVRRTLEQTANLQALKNKNQGKGDAPISIFATEDAVYAYAMWVSTDFFLAVVEAFKHLANGDIGSAYNVAITHVKVGSVMAGKGGKSRLPEIKKMYKDSNLPMDEFVDVFLSNSMNHTKCDLDDRMKTAKALKKLVDASFDNLSPRDSTAINAHYKALTHIAEYSKTKATQVKSRKATEATKKADKAKTVAGVAVGVAKHHMKRADKATGVAKVAVSKAKTERFEKETIQELYQVQTQYIQALGIQ